MCFVSPPKPKKPPVITPPSEDALAARRNSVAEAQSRRGLLGTQRTGPGGLLSAAPTAQKTLFGGP